MSVFRICCPAGAGDVGKRCVSGLAVGICVMVLSFVLAFDSCLWLVSGCMCCG